MTRRPVIRLEIKRRLGIVPDDTPFNRRAKAYAVQSAKLARVKRNKEKKKAK